MHTTAEHHRHHSAIVTQEIYAALTNDTQPWTRAHERFLWEHRNDELERLSVRFPVALRIRDLLTQVHAQSHAFANSAAGPTLFDLLSADEERAFVLLAAELAYMFCD